MSDLHVREPCSRICDRPADHGAVQISRGEAPRTLRVLGELAQAGESVTFRESEGALCRHVRQRWAGRALRQPAAGASSSHDNTTGTGSASWASVSSPACSRYRLVPGEGEGIGTAAKTNAARHSGQALVTCASMADLPAHARHRRSPGTFLRPPLRSITRLDDSGQRGSVCHGNSEVTDASQHTAYAPDRRARSRALGARSVAAVGPPTVVLHSRCRRPRPRAASRLGRYWSTSSTREPAVAGATSRATVRCRGCAAASVALRYVPGAPSRMRSGSPVARSTRADGRRSRWMT